MLTPSQLAAIKADILANPDLETNPNTNAGNTIIAQLYRDPANPEYRVYRTSLDVNEIMNNGFEWTRVDNATVGKARIWEWMTRQGSINPSKPNVRAGIDEAWSGAPNATHLAGIKLHLHRPANRLEKLFATGTGSAESPGTMGLEGTISADEIETARFSL